MLRSIPYNFEGLYYRKHDSILVHLLPFNNYIYIYKLWFVSLSTKSSHKRTYIFISFTRLTIKTNVGFGTMTYFVSVHVPPKSWLYRYIKLDTMCGVMCSNLCTKFSNTLFLNVSIRKIMTFMQFYYYCIW